MKHFTRPLELVCLWILVVGLAGCSLLAPQPDRSKFFVLTALPSNEAGSQAGHSNTGSLVLGLGPIKFPDYLDRAEVVTRVEPNRLEVSQDSHWAGPLKTDFSRILSENLTTLLGTERIVSFPWYSSTHLDYQIAINVERFESDSQGNANLRARWSILAPKSGKVLDRGQSDLNAPGATNGTQSAAALSRVLADFSRQIAIAVHQVDDLYPRR
jgi:uncharacterized protein